MIITLETMSVIVTILLTVLGAISALILRYMAERTTRLEQKLQEQKDEQRRTIDQLLSKQAELIQTIGTLKSTSNTGLSLKGEIDNELKQLARLVECSSASILVPYPLSRDSKFVFLSVLGPEEDKLKKTLIDIHKGIAGYVYKHGYPTHVDDVKSDPRWYGDVDKRMSFDTENIMCLPLLYEGEVIGVIQFLNKPGGFSDQDISKMNKYILSLVARVWEFVMNVGNFEMLGLAASQDHAQGTILVTDLTGSSSLLKRSHPVPMTDVVNLINEYLDRLTTIGFSHRGIVGGMVSS